ncbi:unannotated protein [freshwater metagenome]|uniref:Unannotated protein n=1 Tax=freshwater metagenome TaxID=449393 RepID=A0A6J6HYU4_9ZZZZ
MLILVRFNSGQGMYAPSIAARNQWAASVAVYSTKGANSDQPLEPRKISASRTLTPRKSVFVGIATTTLSRKISRNAKVDVMKFTDAWGIC